MKTTVAILFTLFITTFAQAQENTNKGNLKTVGTIVVTKTEKDLNSARKIEVARLYRLKNARVKKELSFSTKRNRAKMA